MLARPYSIYIDTRPMRIVFLVDPSSASTEIVNEIIHYNQSLWGGRFNPIILTDGHTIEDKWWKFLRGMDPDVIKPLVSLDTELIEKFDNFLSPLTIEQFREDERSSLGIRANVYQKPARIDINALNSFEPGALYEIPTLGIFDLDEIDDEIAKLFVLRNFGTYEPTNTRFHMGGTFRVPQSVESALEQGEVPAEIHEGFKKAGIPFSKEVFSKKSVQRLGSWAIIDKENKQIQYVEPGGHSLFVQPKTQSFGGELSEIKKKVYLVTDRKSLATALLELADTPNILFRNQMCALPNMERESSEDTNDICFEVVVGDTLQDIVYFWNRPLLVERWKRRSVNHMWLPTVLAKDADMEDAFCAWMARVAANRGDGILRTVRFVSFSIEKQELENIASRFRENLYAHHLHVDTVTNCLEEPQIPNFRLEGSFPFQRESSLFSRESTIDIHRVQGNEGILELTEPKGPQRGSIGRWMIDLYIEFTHDIYEDNEYRIKRPGEIPFWRFPNRNRLTRRMFDAPSRIRRNGFPSVMIQGDDKVLRFVLKDVESIIASLFQSTNHPADKHRNLRTQLAAPYYSVKISDKGKYLQGVLELFGNLTFACKVLRSSYWRGMFDTLSKNTHAEQEAHRTVANKLTKLIRREGSLTHESLAAIQSITATSVNESKKLVRQKELPFDVFMQEAKDWQNKYMENMVPVDDRSEGDMIGCRSEDVRGALAELARRNIVQIGVKPRCPSCGAISWYHVDDISQHLTCQGCRIQFPLHPELTWHYKPLVLV